MLALSLDVSHAQDTVELKYTALRINNAEMTDATPKDRWVLHQQDRLDFHGNGAPACSREKPIPVLYVDGLPVKGLEPLSVPGASPVSFQLRRTAESSDLWLDLYHRPSKLTSAGIRAIPVTLGYGCSDSGEKVRAAPGCKVTEGGAVDCTARLTDTFPLVMVPKYRFLAWLGVVLLLGWITWSVLKRGSLRDSPASPETLAALRATVAERQAALANAEAMLAAAPGTPALVMTRDKAAADLMEAQYSLGGAPDPGDAMKSTPWSFSKSQLLGWFLAVMVAASYIGIVTGQLPILSEQVLLFIGVSAGTSILSAALKEERSLQMDPREAWFPAVLRDRTGQVSVARFQAFVVSIGLMLYFLWQAFANLLLPDIDSTWAGLMALSAATYLSSKTSTAAVTR